MREELYLVFELREEKLTFAIVGEVKWTFSIAKCWLSGEIVLQFWAGADGLRPMSLKNEMVKPMTPFRGRLVVLIGTVPYEPITTLVTTVGTQPMSLKMKKYSH